jgi:hypothetical protein
MALTKSSQCCDHVRRRARGLVVLGQVSQVCERSPQNILRRDEVVYAGISADQKQDVFDLSEFDTVSQSEIDVNRERARGATGCEQRHKHALTTWRRETKRQTIATAIEVLIDGVHEEVCVGRSRLEALGKKIIRFLAGVFFLKTLAMFLGEICHECRSIELWCR